MVSGESGDNSGRCLNRSAEDWESLRFPPKQFNRGLTRKLFIGEIAILHLLFVSNNNNNFCHSFKTIITSCPYFIGLLSEKSYGHI